jgi:uncharacterized membrane protein (DUF4010 family)
VTAIPDTLEPALRLGVAALGGLAVGIEREWSARARSRPARFAGVRTFLLLGLLGGLAPQIALWTHVLLGVLLLIGTSALVVVAYAMTARTGDVEGTTEVSALVVLGAGTLAGAGQLALASGIYALTALVLVEKSRIHGLVHRIQSQALEAGARFAVLALVILPLLPEGPVGPAPGFRPRELWTLVLLFSGVSFAGYLALRLVGPGRGHGLAGLLGGLISSTAVTVAFARESRDRPDQGPGLGLGVVAASTVLFLRVTALAAFLNPAVGLRVVPYFATPLAVGVLATGLLGRRGVSRAAEAKMPDNPLRLAAAAQMAVAFQLVLYVMHWVGGRFGSPGLFASAALLGLTDVDALTYSLTRLAFDSAQTAARALAIGTVANTLLKVVVALALGRGVFRPIVGTALAALATATALALVALP